MKILQVNSVFRKGSTGKIVNDIHSKLLEYGHQSMVCYGRGPLIKESNINKFCSELEAKIQGVYNRLGGLMYGGSWFSTYRLIKYIKTVKPDIVHLHCINGYCVNIFRLLEFLGKEQINTVITHHGEFFYTGNCGHSLDCSQWQNIHGCQKCPASKKETGALFFDRSNTAWHKMKNAFSTFEKKKLIFIAVSPWVKERSLLSPIVNDYECKVVGNGINTNIFHPYANEYLLRNRIPQCKSKVVLHVSAYFTTSKNSLKGGWYIIELAKNLPDVSFVVVASSMQIKADIPPNVYILGRAQSQIELAKFYSEADISLIVSQRETFSMVCAESLCCGTPIVGFKAGGPESVSIAEFSSFVEYGNILSLSGRIKDFLQRKWDKQSIAEKALQLYSREKMTNEYIYIYNEMNS